MKAKDFLKLVLFVLFAVLVFAFSFGFVIWKGIVFFFGTDIGFVRATLVALLLEMVLFYSIKEEDYYGNK